MEDLKREIRGRELANLFHPPPPSELPSLLLTLYLFIWIAEKWGVGKLLKLKKKKKERL
jgi:hypothetical protein